MSYHYAHQISGADFLVETERGYLADPPGMGKTRTLALALKASGGTGVVVCPAIVRDHWKNELRFIGGDALIYSYDNIVAGGFPLMRDLITKEGVNTLIVDEVHYCKHTTSQRSRFLFGRDGYSRRMENVWLGSGTPMPKNPSEMYTQACTLVPELLKELGLDTHEKWKSRFCVTRGRLIRSVWVEKVVDVKRQEEMQLILDTFMIRRTNGIDLPEIWWQHIPLNGHLEAGLDIYAGTIIAALDVGELESIACDPHVARMRRRLGELKVAPVVEMLRGQLADSTEKIAVFAYHTNVLREIALALDAFGVAFIDGSTSESRRITEKDRFISDPKCRVFVGQSTTCGTGMDGLQHATHRVVIVEQDWTENNNVQLARRIARPGQKHNNGPCIIQMVSLAGTLDDAVVAQCKREAEIQTKIWSRDE